MGWQPDREELAWAAGFFDGEGCFSWATKGRFGCAVIAQTDRAALDRFQAAVASIGKTYGPYAQRQRDGWNRKHRWSYRVHRREEVQAVAALLWFKLGAIRRAQATKILLDHPRTCRRGHDLMPGARRCPRCVAAAWAAKRTDTR